ncbi:cytosine permease [Conexibacter sp. DBS9H8]|uniref:purine-cytosine permease family protein n=1 Tax=Conexibacter sp. DBS9H8 TaxID=2937801 RepID=UPI00200D2182|nr:cytosine permease [Conexibacter sp. DBS9H8]
MNAVIASEAGAGPGGPIGEEPTFESRGIDYIPAADRRGRPIDLAWMWAGALFNVEYVVYGATLIVGFGLRFWQAAVVILVGNLSYLITGIGSLPGPRAGTAGFTINRAPFGPNGARVVASFNWLTQVGFEVLGLYLVVSAGQAILGQLGVRSSTELKIALIVGAAAIQLLLPLLGHGTMMRVLRWLAIPFALLFVLLAILTVGKAHLGAGHDASWAAMMGGLAFMFSTGGYGWPMNASDYSRYLPADSSRRQIVGSVFLGSFLPASLCLLLGAAVATAVASATDPIAGLPKAFPGWFLLPYLIVVVVQLFAINSLDLYTSGLTLQSILPRIRRWQCVLLDTVLAGGLTAVTVFSAGFYTDVTDFTLFILIWIAPWVAIYLVDFFLRRGRYDRDGLMATARGIYYRRGGVHWPGIVALVVGALAAASWLNAYPAWTSAPLSKATGGSDFSTFMGALFGGGLYWLLTRRSVPAEAERSRMDEPPSPPG